MIFKSHRSANRFLLIAAASFAAAAQGCLFGQSKAPAAEIPNGPTPVFLASASQGAGRQSSPITPDSAPMSNPAPGTPPSNMAPATSGPALPNGQTPALRPPMGSLPQNGGMPPNNGNGQTPGVPIGPPLTRAEAEQMAIKSNPKISVSRLLALAQHQVVRQSRAAELPTITGSVTAEDAYDASRISAGFLTSSRLFTHAGAGANFSQLLTDFGRTHNLVASSKLQEKAQNATALATTEDIVIATDQAFYNALQAQALLRVAYQTVSTRNTTQTQINELTNNNLKSTLDLSFANVNLSQAKLLQLDAQDNVDSTMAALDEVLGLDKQVAYSLVDNTEALATPPPDPEHLVQLALQQRPDLQSLGFQQQADLKFAKAQHDQMLPSITTTGTLGSVPVRPDQYYTSNWWGAIGVNLNIPIFEGFLYSAQAKEAQYRAQAESEETRDLRDKIVRDVRMTWLAANNAYQKVGVTAELLNEANLALKLAQTRYDLGLSNIVELSQAQFQQTDAAIGNTNAQYQYRLTLANINYQIGATP